MNFSLEHMLLQPTVNILHMFEQKCVTANLLKALFTAVSSDYVLSFLKDNMYVIKSTGNRVYCGQLAATMPSVSDVREEDIHRTAGFAATLRRRI